ncbi:MAG: HAD-IIA family hydrolase [Candidatus Methylomirabilia bacterium]
MTIRFPYRGWVFDLDGTIYRGKEVIPGAPEVIRALRDSGRRVVFLSNKPIQTREEYAKKLTRLGIPTEADEVVNSSLVLARYLASHDPGASCFVIGEPPLIAELRAHGLRVRENPDVSWVVIAFDRTFTYAKLNTALQAVRRGARLIATNPDRTCPTESGEVPDCAGMIAAVEAVSGAHVEVVVGKPSPLILEAALDVLGLPASGCVIVGDRIETDIAMGRALGLATILVLSGVTAAQDPRVGDLTPDRVLRSIREILHA